MIINRLWTSAPQALFENLNHFPRGAIEVHAMVQKDTQRIVDVRRIQMELLAGQDIAVFLDNLVVKDRGNIPGINMGKDDKGRGRQVFRYQCGNEHVCVDDRIQVGYCPFLDAAISVLISSKLMSPAPEASAISRIL